MKYLIAVLLTNCATVQSPEGYLPTPEQMPQGRVQCRALCASYAREYVEYRYDGKCVCRGEGSLNTNPTAHE